MKLNLFRCVVVAPVVMLTLIAAAGCSQQRTPYGRYLDARARHEAAAEVIESHGGHVAYEDPGTAVTLDLADKTAAGKAMAAVSDLFDVYAVTLIHGNTPLKSLGDLPKLQHVTLRDTPLTDAGLKYLAAQPHLAELHLLNTGLDDARLAQVAASLPDLEQLTVGYDPVTDAGLEPLARLTDLRRLTLANTDVTADAAAKLIDTNPRLIIRLNDQTLKSPEAGE